MKKLMLLMFLLLAAMLTSNASATLLTNGGFEAPALGDGNWDGTTAPDDWSWAGPGTYHWHGDPGSAHAAQPPEGVQYVEVGAAVALDQNVAHTVLADKLYTFTVQARTFSDVSGSFVLWIGWDNWSDYISTSHFQSISAWEEFSITLDTSALGNGAAAVGATELNVEVWTVGEIFHYDDASLVEVPEPATIGLLSLGGLLLRRRRR